MTSPLCKSQLKISRTLLIEGSFSPIICCHRVIAELILCQRLNISMGDMISLIPTMWPFLDLFSIRCPQSKQSKSFQIPGFHFH